MNPHLTVVGSLNMGLVIRSARIPRSGETIIGSDFQTIPGGKSANQAVAAARLGADVSMVGCLGSDTFADVLLKNLNVSGVDAAHVHKDKDAATGVALIVVDKKGKNSIIVASGANMFLTETEIEAAENVIAASNVLLLQLEVPLAVVIRAAQIARDHDVPVILNPAPARELPENLFKLVDVLVPNESETALLTGLESGNPAELGPAADILLDMGVGSVVITLGKQGAFLRVQDTGSQLFDAFKIKAVDTIDAGDAFVAGLVVRMGAGYSLAEAIHWGNAAGALAAMRFGAQTSMPNEEEVNQLISGVNPDIIIGREP